MPGYFYANGRLEELTFEELKAQSGGEGGGGFLPAVKQIANVAALPGIVKVGTWTFGRSVRAVSDQISLMYFGCFHHI